MEELAAVLKDRSPAPPEVAPPVPTLKPYIKSWLEEHAPEAPVEAPPVPAIERYADKRSKQLDDDIEELLEDVRKRDAAKAPEGFVPEKPTEFIKDRMYDARAVERSRRRSDLTELIKELTEKPFDTTIDLRKLDFDKDDATEALSKWFDEHIANKVGETIYVLLKFTNYDKVLMFPLLKYVERIRRLFTEGPLFSIEEESSGINSGDDAPLYWNVVDTIAFTKIEKIERPKKARSSHANGFFPRKLTDTYASWESVLERYQIFYKYTTVSSSSSVAGGGVKKSVNTPCLLHCLKLAGVDADTCNNILSYIGHQKRVQRTLLGEIGNDFNLYFHVRIYDERKKKIDNGNQNNNGWYGKKTGQQIFLAEYMNHFFLDEEMPVNKFAIDHWSEIVEAHPQQSTEWMMKVCERGANGKFKIKAARAKAKSLDVVVALDKAGAFTHINADHDDVQRARIFTREVEQEDAIARPYVVEHETKLIAPKKAATKAKEHPIFYADFETCKRSDNDKTTAVPFMMCASNVDGSWKKTYVGANCAGEFLNDLPNDALVYYHNLGFDGNFFKQFGFSVMIQKGSKIMNMKARDSGKTIILRDSYSLLSKPLRDFPSAFPQAFRRDGSSQGIEKEVFPYDYYTYERLYKDGSVVDFEIDVEEASKYVKECDREQFKENVERIGKSALDYCAFYCERDVDVLRIGFNAFAEATLKDPIGMNIHDYISAPSLAYSYMLQKVFYPNGKIYNVGGQLQRFLQKFVYGGRVMTAKNIRYDVRKKLADFDACSLYPSAMRRAFTVEGVPEYYQNPTPEAVYNRSNLPEILTKAFTEDQLTPTAERIYSQFFIEIQIVAVGIERHFPLIVERKDGKQSNVNECVKMCVDMIMLQDLIEFQDISFTFIDGYVMKGNRDHRIRDEIKKLYDYRVQFKKEKNPMQEVVKLIMNSAYGKSIQKPIKTDLRFVSADKVQYKLFDCYHQIVKAEPIVHCAFGSVQPDVKAEPIGGERSGAEGAATNWLFEMFKRRSNQFNNAIFGITVLSISKRIMNEVMCLAEDMGIEIYYQDTDSMHIEWDRVDDLDREFTKKYGRKLIGSDMGNFHTDFSPADAYCVRHISLGKKMYLDVLESPTSGRHLHIRMMGIPEQVIKNHA